MESSTKNRLNYADIAKAIAIFLVIVGHVRPNIHYVIPYKSFIYAFHMPLFFLISGMFINTSREIYSLSTWKNFISKNFKALIIPLLIFGLIYMNFSYQNVLIFLFNSRMAYIKVGTLSSLWFLPVLFLARILLEGLFNFVKNFNLNLNIIKPLFAIIFLITGIILPHHNLEGEFGNFLSYDIAFVAAGFMLLGNIFKPLFDKLANLKPLNLLFLFSIFSALFVYGFNLTNYKEEFVLMCQGTYCNPYLFVLNSLTASFAVLIFSILWDKLFGENRFIKFVGVNTLGIYLIHKNMLPDLISFFSQYFSNDYILAPIVSTIALIASCVLVLFFRKFVPEIIGAKK